MFTLLPSIGRARYRESQVSLAVYSLDRTFTSGGVDLHAHLFVDHHCVLIFFAVGLDREIILTAKFFPIYGM